MPVLVPGQQHESRKDSVSAKPHFAQSGCPCLFACLRSPAGDRMDADPAAPDFPLRLKRMGPKEQRASGCEQSEICRQC